MPTIILTRPHAQSMAMLPQVQALGLAACVAPVQSVVLHPYSHELDEKLQAAEVLVASSQQAVLAVTQAFPKAHWHNKLWVVPSEATQEVARAQGISQILTGGGDAAGMVHTMLEHTTREAHVCYLRGDEVRVDVAQKLRDAGRIAESAEVYQVQPLPMTEELRALLQHGERCVFTLYSVRALRTAQAWLHALGAVAEAVCFSQAIAQEAEASCWKACHVVARPEQEQMLATLKTLYARA